MTNYFLTQINIYPIKSLQGISLKASQVEERGLKYDRRWMLVDEQNKFITQRIFPQMALINIEMEKDQFLLSHKIKKLEELRITLNKYPTNEIKVKVWNDVCEAVVYESEINDWFSKAIETKTKLVYMTNSTERKTSAKYVNKSQNVSFADGYPILIIGEESLNNLNRKLNFPVEMKRFRPNLVFSGGMPHDEDQWDKFSIRETKLHVVKPCSRCVLTTVDPGTGAKGKEPLHTLSTYRMKNNKVLFGQNLVVENAGNIKVGNILNVNEKKNNA